jgi:hypothetical protein
MEIAALLALGGAGYFLTQQTTPNSKQIARKELDRRPTSLTEHFADASKAAPGQQASMGRVKDAQGTSARGSMAELDLMYGTLMSKPAPPSDPNPAGPINAIPGSQRPSFDLQRRQVQPAPEGITSATADVMMNPAGIEEEPVYVEGDYVVSPLSGQRMKTSDFVHNNMQPFAKKFTQNVDYKGNTNSLDYMQGSGDTFIGKREVEPMFDTGKTPYGNVYGLEASAGFIQSRINDPRNRNGERPFEPVRVGSAVGEGFGQTGKGGFQQTEINDLMMKNIRRTDDLRVATNPKLTYKMPVVPGQHFVGSASAPEAIGEVRKYKPDRFYIDENGERFGVGTSEVTKETSRSIQVMRHTTRPETSVSYSGPAQSTDYNTSYVVGSYRNPMTQSYAADGFRNADLSTYTKPDTDAPENDYGRSSWEARPNERDSTRERTMGLNVAPAEAGATTIHYEDSGRPTRRAETEGNIRQAGTPVGYAGGAPAVTVWDPEDIARTTVRETTIQRDRFGIAAVADGPTKLIVYDPDDIARPTQKHQISAKSEYFGGGQAAHQRSMSHASAYNMRLNPSKQQIAKGRKPVAGNGVVGTFKGDPGQQRSKKLNTDFINDRTPAVNYVPGIPTGVGDIGAMKFRTPVKLDVSMERFNQDMVSAVESNPLNISLRKNAEHDTRLLDHLLQERAEGAAYAPMPADF